MEQGVKDGEQVHARDADVVQQATELDAVDGLGRAERHARQDQLLQQPVGHVSRLRLQRRGDEDVLLGRHERPNRLDVPPLLARLVAQRRNCRLERLHLGVARLLPLLEVRRGQVQRRGGGVLLLVVEVAEAVLDAAQFGGISILRMVHVAEAEAPEP